MLKRYTVAALAALAPSIAAQCISLSGSTACSAFNTSSITTNSQLVGLFPFLSFVSNVRDFDREVFQYVNQGYVQLKYINLFGCNNVSLANTTDYYARYTISFICNSIVQNSQSACNPSGTLEAPLCADSCADFALSEEAIVSNTEFCSGRNADYASQLRADFTNCALPAESLTGRCIMASANEPGDCGFASNLVGLCNYCRASTENATDSCCFTSNTSQRCQGVELPVFSSIADLFSTTGSMSSSPTSTSTANMGVNRGGSGLSGGAIAGIVIGSLAGFALLLALIILGCFAIRRRRQNDSSSSILNQPSPQRKGGPASQMSYQHTPTSQQGYEILAGGRVARMKAMQNDEAPEIGPRGYSANPEAFSPSSGIGSKTALAAGGAGIARSQHSSPDSNDYSSPEGVASGQSEQLPFFKDYYSNDDIRPNDKVSVLWAYQPRAGDEFELERGDMLKVIGIWDDGWATGVRINDRAEDYDGKHKLQRDSGVSNGNGDRDDSPAPSGEIKAFPLVCVCLPEAWRKTVEGDSSTEGGSAGAPPV